MGGMCICHRSPLGVLLIVLCVVATTFANFFVPLPPPHVPVTGGNLEFLGQDR